MSDRAAAAAIQPSGARRCRWPVQGESRPQCAPSGLDSLAHSQEARRPAARQQELPDVAIGGVELSCAPLSRFGNECRRSQAEADSILGDAPDKHKESSNRRKGVRSGWVTLDRGRLNPTSMHVRFAPKADREADI